MNTANSIEIDSYNLSLPESATGFWLSFRSRRTIRRPGATALFIPDPSTLAFSRVNFNLMPEACSVCKRSKAMVRSQYLASKTLYPESLLEYIKLGPSSGTLFCIECFYFMQNYFRVERDRRFDVRGYCEMLSGTRPWSPALRFLLNESDKIKLDTFQAQ